MKILDKNGNILAQRKADRIEGILSALDQEAISRDIFKNKWCYFSKR